MGDRLRHLAAMRASMRVKPHLLTDDTLVLRSGARTRVDVPLAALASTHPRSTSSRA